MRLSSLADYAVVMMAAAARASCASGRLSATVLAEQTGVPLPTAQKLVGRLAAAGLVDSARGSGGGFRLARPAAAISLADIVEAVEGPIAMTVCVDDSRHHCALDQRCAVRPHWGVVNEAIRGALAGVSLAALAAPPSASASHHHPRAGGGPGAEVSATGDSPSSSTNSNWTPAFAGVVTYSGAGA